MVHSGLSNASLFNPPGNSAPNVAIFRDLVLKDLTNLRMKTVQPEYDVRIGIEALCRRKDIIIRPADKGGAIVILDKDSYNNEMQRILSDADTYLPLQSDPTLSFKRELKGLIDKGYNMGILNKKEREHLIPLAPRLPVMYILPKIHKTLVNPPGRPIISGIDSITSRVGKYIDFYLQPLVMGTPAFLKDTKHVLNILGSIEWKDTYMLVTADVASLYTSISHRLGHEAVRHFLYRDSNISITQCNFVMELLDFSMAHNHFWHNNKHYLQTRGVAMGAKFAPSMANLFMAKWEEDIVFCDKPSQLVLWRRFIDDVLFIWDGDSESLSNFLLSLNGNDRGIALTYEASSVQIHFLDLLITIVDGRITTSTFFKSTDRNSFIPLNSCHHQSWLSAVPKGQFLRLRRNCSDQDEYFREASSLKLKFLDKGYEATMLETLIAEVGNRERTELLRDKPPQVNNGEDFNLAFLTTYSSQHWAIKKIIKRHWPVIKNDRVLGPLLPNNPRILFRGAMNLRHTLAPNVPDPPQRSTFFGDLKGFSPCRRCRVCRVNAVCQRRLTEFTSTGTGVTYPINSLITCASKCVVYLLRCPCGLEYVGRTTRKLSVRLGEHITNIKQGFDKHSVSRHYDEVHNRDPSGTTFIGIEKYVPHWRGSNGKRTISRSETNWIFRLGSHAPNGLNIEWDINCFINNS